MAHPHRRHEDYQVGVICALATEKAAVVAMLDEEHPKLKKEEGDDNEYTLGRIRVHNVVIACLPAGLMGNGPAAIVAKDMRRSFPIKFGLMVGVGGGVWSSENDIRLGDIVVSQPTDSHGGVVQWDFGKMGKDGNFRRTGSLDKPPLVLLHALQELKMFDITDGVDLERPLSLMVQNKPRMGQTYRYQGADYDQLFQATYDHESDGTCDKCDPKLIVQRPTRDDSTPRIHYGNIASGNEVMKHGPIRDKIAREEGVICFEMEAAGLMDNFPCLVIRGICDYADSHKNKRWQPYAAATAAAFAKVLLGFINEQEVIKTPMIKYEDFSVTSSLATMSGVDRFVAREKELAEIHTNLSSDGSHRIVVLHGLGGIGKTQLSIAYAKRYKHDYSAIFWLNIKDENSIKQSYISIARHILREHPSTNQLSSVDMKNSDEVIEAVKAWLCLPNNTRWLMIYDNYDNPKSRNNTDLTAIDILQYLPESDQGSIIITTRSSEVKVGHYIRIRKLENVQDCLQILSNISNREGLQNDSDAIKLVQKLDGLPLALATAGAYLNQVTISLSDYFRLYEKSWAKLQKTSPGLNSYEDRTLYSTWQISFDHVKQQNRLSAKLLQLWAYFDNQDLWLELFQHSDSKDPVWIHELVEDELSFHGAMRVLSAHGLVEIHTSLQDLIESQGYSIHGCVHLWTIHVLNQEWNYNLARTAIKLVASHIPGRNNIQWWLTQQRLLQHVSRCAYIVSNGLAREDSIEWAYNNLGNLYRNQGKLAEAEQMYERALQGYEKALGPEHTSTLRTVNNLGNLYRNQGKLAEAEQMYERALQGYEKALGPDNITTYIPALDTTWGLGSLFKHQGGLAKARIMYLKALEGYIKVGGPNHPRSQTLRDMLHGLDLMEKNNKENVHKHERAPEQIQGEIPPLRNERDLSSMQGGSRNFNEVR